MKKYSTLLLSSTLLLTSLAQPAFVIAEESDVPAATTETTTQVSTETDASETTIEPPIAVTEAAEVAPADKATQELLSQQTDSTLSLFYQRSASQKNLKIDYAIWSNDQGQDDLRWIRAQDYQTDISLADFQAGQYTVHTYITINNQAVFLQASSLSITRPKPSLTSSISQEGVLDIVVHNVSPDTKEVLLPTWSQVNGQDDLKWYSAQKQENGTYALRVLLKQHQFNTGAYMIHLYTKNSQGQQTFITKTEHHISKQDVPANPKPTIAIEQLQAGKGTYQVTVQENNTSKPIQSVQVASWSTANQSNIQWRTASLQNGKYQVGVDFQAHQNHTGHYQNHVYVTYKDGSRVGYISDTVNLTSARLLVQFKANLSAIGQMQATFTNVYDKSPVQYAVWSDENGQDDLKWYSANQIADKTYTGTILLNNHKGTGKYHVHAYQSGKGLGAFSMDVAHAHRYNTHNTYPVGECTWGSKEAAPWVGNYWGNANQWPASARAAGFRTGTSPQVGAIAVWTAGRYGHVGVVTAVESHHRIRIQECNYAGKRYVGDFRGWFNPVADGVTVYIYPN